MLVTLMFSVAAKKSRTFPVSGIQRTSRCSGAGREHGQADSPAGQWKHYTPQTSCSVNEWRSAWRGGSSLLSCFCELESFLV